MSRESSLQFGTDFLEALNTVTNDQVVDVLDKAVSLPKDLRIILENNSKLARLFVLIDKALEKAEYEAYSKLLFFFRKVVNNFYGYDM